MIDTQQRFLNTQSNCIVCNGPIFWVLGKNYGLCMRSVCRAKQPGTIVRIIKGETLKITNVTDTTN